MRLPKEEQPKERLINTVRWPVAWQSGESGQGHSTQNDVISIILYHYGKSRNSPIANILHVYTGKIMLSFCPDMASSTDPSPMIIPYLTTLQNRSAGAATS